MEDKVKMREYIGRELSHPIDPSRINISWKFPLIERFSLRHLPARYGLERLDQIIWRFYRNHGFKCKYYVEDKIFEDEKDTSKGYFFAGDDHMRAIQLIFSNKEGENSADFIVYDITKLFTSCNGGN